MVDVTDGISLPSTCRFSVPGALAITPAHRASRATEPCSWMTHSGCLAPSLGDLLADSLTGDVLIGAEVHQRAEILVLLDAGVEADNRNARVDRGLHRVLHGVRRQQGRRRCRRPCCRRRSGSGWPRPDRVGSLEYFRSMLSLAAATSAPARILSQNESPGASWVTIAMVSCGVSATAPPPAGGAPAAGRPRRRADSAAFLPPVRYRRSSASAATTATAVSPRAFLRIVIDSGPFVAGQRVPVEVGTSGMATDRRGRGCRNSMLTGDPVPLGHRRVGQRETALRTSPRKRGRRTRPSGSRRRHWRPFDPPFTAGRAGSHKSGLRHM